MFHFDRRRIRVGTAILVATLAPGTAPDPAHGQDALLFSTAGTAQVQSARFAPFSPSALFRYEPGRSAESYPFLHAQNLDVLVGDGDNNGELDDAPANIDAIAWSPNASQWRTAFDLVVSFSTTTRLAGGSVRDGDLVQLQPGGAFVVVADEATLSSVTSTSGVDVDAVAFLPSGEIAFSFAEDEVTTDPNLIAANANDPKLGDETIFAWKPGRAGARILHTKAALIAAAANAIGQSLTSIVDVTGIAIDPGNPGDLLFTTGSSSKALGGIVFTTANGGAIASLNNVQLNAQNAWGFSARPGLDALETYPQSKNPVAIRLDRDRIITPATASIVVQCDGAAPGGTIQLFASFATLPVQSPFAIPRGIGAVPFGFLTIGDPLFPLSPRIPLLRVPIDSTGRGQVRIAVGQVPPGLSYVLQGVDLSTLEATWPTAVDLVSS